MPNNIIDKASFIVMIASWLFSWIFYWNYSNEAVYSFMAAILTALFVWVGYIALRVIILAIKR